MKTLKLATAIVLGAALSVLSSCNSTGNSQRSSDTEVTSTSTGATVATVLTTLATAPSTAVPTPITASVASCTFPLPFVEMLPWGTCTQGDAVQRVQYRLQDFGYQLDADGYFGPATEIALIAYQRANGLTDDGIVNFDTWKAMFEGFGLPGTDYNGDGVITPEEIIYD